jgi:transcription-repair coupling factor (superfamily II helicase)
MVGFVKGEIDILLSTTIVENGIDISNANTLIVENADRLGLSQLYQLRGRVGRSDRQAYAYFLYSGAFDSTLSAPSVMEANQLAVGGRKKKKMTVSEGAMARLQALQEFSALGAGYSLAFRDLQIRGAGELLGAKQSGTMVSVGYELYTQLIQEAVASLKDSVDGVPASMREEVADPLASLEPLPQFDLPVDARLPDTYIKDQAQRLYYYQRMMSARDEITLGLVQGEVEDRYGKPTDEVRNAFTVMSLRVRAKALGLDKVEARGGRLNVTFVDKTAVPTRAFSLLAKVNRDMYMTREAMIWPYSGPPLRAVESMMDAFVNVLDEVERARALWN